MGKSVGKGENEKSSKPKEKKSKTDGATKKKKSTVKNSVPNDLPEQTTVGAGGDAESMGRTSRMTLKDEQGKDNGGFKPAEPEWNSETVQSTNLVSDGFSCCLVMVMEDSPQLSKYGEYLLKAVESGVRKKFTCISGAQTAERVKRFMINTGQRDWQATDDSFMERQDLFAEAIKFSLLGIKDTVSTEIDADITSREMELAGARSKDFVRYVPPVTLSIQQNIGGDGELGIREPPPPPPPTEIGHSRKSKKQQDGSPDDLSGKEGSGRNIGVKTRMRKRGEVPMPEFEVIDDSPTKGPRSYVLLQGFYNPHLIDELRKIGVNVDGILLMTDENVTRYNFSIMDVEDSIPGTFRPRNVLPQYLKTMEKLMQDPETRNTNVIQFWATLTEMYNSAPSDSPFYDIALMNFCLPDSSRLPLDTPDGLTVYVSRIFDEVAKRVYEMLVLEEWFHEFSAAADVTQLQPLEPSLPCDVYEQIVGQIPAECMSVPIILEAVVQQVSHTMDVEKGLKAPEPCFEYEDDITEGLVMGKADFGSTKWGLAAKDNGEKRKKTVVVSDTVTSNTPSPASSPIQPLFKIPLYIKAGDYASIRSCHLSESLASKIASCQLSGDIRNINGFLWNNVPEFNKGLYMKLLGNLNHFMYFLPPNMIQFEDMFYILHLLMSAGVEVQLQKQAEKAERKKSDSMPKDLSRPSEMLMNDDLYFQNRPESEEKFPGTNLSMDHNYLAVDPKNGMHFVIQPTSTHQLTIASFGHSENLAEGAEGNQKITQNDIDSFFKETQTMMLGDNETPVDGKNKSITKVSKKAKKKKSKHTRKTDQAVDPAKVARITVTNALESAVEVANNMLETTDKMETAILESRRQSKDTNDDTITDPKPIEEIPKKKLSTGSKEGDKKIDSTQHTFEPKRKSNWGEMSKLADAGGGGDLASSKKSMIEGDSEGASVPKKSGFASQENVKEKKRFIACEEEFFNDIHDASVIQALLECPALLAISESGALDLTKWVEKYLFSCGMDVGGGVLLGDLKNWNYVEELVPVQTVQMLNEATQDYLSMQRMYCPFYDTLLFIFNNPTPKTLTKETQFYLRLKTLPGLQHFLEYTMNDRDVLKWIEQIDSSKRLEMGETCSINTLLHIIPEEQWILVPSIKYQIMVENAHSTPLQKAKISKMFPIGNSPIQGISPNSYPLQSPESQQGGGFSAPGESGPEQMGETVVELDSGEQRGSIGSRRQGRESTMNAASKQPSETINETPPRGSKDEHKENSRGNVGDGEERKLSSVIDNNAAELSALQAVANAIAFPEDSGPDEKDLIRSSLQFTCYDLGKRVAVVGNNTFYIFPMDGTLVRYDISTIEPEFRMMQLSITKNGHQAYFYPYYIPHDFDLSKEDYVVCPYFHLVLSNGTIFAFQDLRAEEAAPYMKVAIKEKHPQSKLFGYEKILFGKEVEQKLNEMSRGSENETPVEGDLANNSDQGKRKTSHESSRSKKSDKSHRSDQPAVTGEVPAPDPTVAGGDDGKKVKKGVKEKKSKKAQEKPPTPEHEQVKNKKPDKKSKKKGTSKTKADVEAAAEEEVLPVVDDSAVGVDVFKQNIGETEVGIGNTPPVTTEAEVSLIQVPGITEDEVGEWMYPSSDNSEDEAEAQNKRRLFFAPPWDEAVKMIQPLAHMFKVTLPSGLLVTVEDLPGPPLLRIVKQSYIGQGSAKSSIESSRYYTMDGSVIKFLNNGVIQILTARGVTTNINELAANNKRDSENPSFAFGAASIVKIFNGEVILPNGQQWQVINGKKVTKSAMYVFTTGPLSGGEIFRRRQDGVIYLHRYDGTVITHYPDGTRFTTRMVVLEDSVEEFEDWVFVGLKYMVEHPNYCTILFNTLSANTHLKLPHGEWVRVFADGNIRIATEDECKFDVDRTRAVLSHPPCAMGGQSLPNMTAVRLWHAAPPDKVTNEQTTGEIQPTKETPLPESQKEVKKPKEKPNAHHRQSSPIGDLKAKKESKRNVAERTKSLHPKIKQKDPRTRMSAKMMATQKSRSPSPPPLESSAPSSTLAGGDGINSKTEVNTGVSGGVAVEASTSAVDNLVDNNVEKQETVRKPSLRDCGGLSEFLQFDDETTFCKCIDSWDNRFAMNIYGSIVVDKMIREEMKEQSTQHLIETLSEHCNLPKDYFSGILRNTSSEHLTSGAKRMQSYKQNYNESCNSHLPNTKVFVVKRDLTGFQYLQKSQVDEVVTKAYSSRESMVIVDPLPKRQPRKFITVMRPVEEVEQPHGMWTRPYIEPMFRPRNVTNKDLRIANPNDLRWFGYVLSSAHGKKPKFVPGPKQRYQHMKETMHMVNTNPPPPPEPEPEKPVESFNENAEEEYEDEEYEGERSDREALKFTPSFIDDDKKEKKKKGKDKDGEKKHGKKDKKGKRKESTPIISDEEEPVGETEGAETERGLAPKQKALKIQDLEPEIGEYPSEIEDIRGIYDMEDNAAQSHPRISLKHHGSPCNTKKAVVVRAFVEIPKIDENMQRALLAASMSYADTVKSETALFKSFKSDDPRTEQEKKAQIEYKQQLIEQNMDEMHLLEQKPGPVLRFHF